jgi:type IV secretory pathway component VirB8
MTETIHDYSSLSILDQQRVSEHAAVVRTFRDRLYDDERRRRRIWFASAIVGWAIAGVAISGYPALLPLKTLIPFFLVTHDDGTIDSGISLSDLGADMMDKVTRAAVWRYVEQRESYSYSDALHRYNLVSLMSSEGVQHDYQQWFRLAPDGPQKALGKTGTISVKEIAMIPVRDTEHGGVFEVRFWRSVLKTGTSPQTTSHTATVEYERLPTVSKEMILGGDEAGLLIVRYKFEDNTP